jgi:hypothetical protein
MMLARILGNSSKAFILSAGGNYDIYNLFYD